MKKLLSILMLLLLLTLTGLALTSCDEGDTPPTSTSATPPATTSGSSFGNGNSDAANDDNWTGRY